MQSEPANSVAAKGLASRRAPTGPALWLQQAIAKRSITVEKQAAATVSPDIGTKAWDTHSEDAAPTSPFGCTHDVGLVMVLRSGKTTLHRSAPWIRTCMTRKANQPILELDVSLARTDLATWLFLTILRNLTSLKLLETMLFALSTVDRATTDKPCCDALSEREHLEEESIQTAGVCCQFSIPVLFSQLCVICTVFAHVVPRLSYLNASRLRNTSDRLVASHTCSGIVN